MPVYSPHMIFERNNPLVTFLLPASLLPLGPLLRPAR